MGIKASVIILAKILLLVLFSQVSAAYGQSDLSEQSTLNNDSKIALKTDLQDKYYRQALYFYFQGNHQQALSQVEQSKVKLDKLNSRSALFESGFNFQPVYCSKQKQH